MSGLGAGHEGTQLDPARRAVHLRLTPEGDRRLASVLEATGADRRALAGAFRELSRTFRATRV
jgi:hypothetical protein